MGHRLAPEAVAELDDIWLFVARESGSIETADRLITSITGRFVLLASRPHLGRRRDHDLRPGLRSFAVNGYVIIYRIDGDDTLILRVIHGRRDLPALFGD